MNELIPFDFETQALRVIMNEDAEPWFVATDVCAVLDLKNPRQVVSALKDKEKGVRSMDTLGGKQELTVISESGFYKTVFKSRKEKAERFTDWVTSEVLPTLRKTGRYIFDAEIDENEAETPDEMASLGRGMRIREHRRVFSEVSQLVNLANRMHSSQLEIVNTISQRLTGIDTVAMLKESGWQAPCLPSPTQPETDYWQNLVEAWLSEPEQQNVQYISNREILAGAIGFEDKNMTISTATQVGFIMKKLGWGKKRMRQTGGKATYVYVRPTTTH